MRDKKGLDTVVTTLIIVLLAIVAVGIVWVVVRGVVTNTSSQVKTNAQCTTIDLSATQVTAVSGQPGNYSVTIMRNTGFGSDPMAGIQVSFSNATASSGVIDFGSKGVLTPGEKQTAIISTQGNVTNATSMTYAAYVTDDSGNPQTCTSQTYPI